MADEFHAINTELLGLSVDSRMRISHGFAESKDWKFNGLKNIEVKFRSLKTLRWKMPTNTG
jgi:peroxiredoxin (alkyl hydroperoxide reductase subunit C)